MRHLKNQWWMRTRSYENECYICFAHPTLSLVTDPRGDILARRSSWRPGILLAELDLASVPSVMLDARRPELYRSITRPRRAKRAT
jgi:predicted amidohydrolase